MAAMLAGRVALGLGTAPKVCPKCTGAVEGLLPGAWAGMAAAESAALGCGARIAAGLAALMGGSAILASIWMGFSGFGSSLGITILGASSFPCGTTGSGILIFGGGVSFSFAGGGVSGIS